MASGLAKGLAVGTAFHATTLAQRSPPTEEKSVPRGAWCCAPVFSPIPEQASEKRARKSAERAEPWDGPALLIFLLDKGNRGKVCIPFSWGRGEAARQGWGVRSSGVVWTLAPQEVFRLDFHCP